jgi:DegV family protein with EDD domain
VYGELTQLGHPIFSIHISSKLSGTMNSALAAKAAFPQAQIEVVDWLSMGMGMLVLVAAQAAEEGKSLAEIKAIMEWLITRTNVIGTINTLKYLQAGGRFAIMAFVGNLLSIKPVLAMRNNKVKLIARTRSRNKAIRYMLGLMEQRADKSAPIHGAVVHTRALEEARALEQEIRARYNCEELYLVELGPVFAAHTGPGTLGLVFYNGAT